MRLVLVFLIIALSSVGLVLTIQLAEERESQVVFVAHDQGYDEGYERGVRDNLREMLQANQDLTKAFSECIEREMQCNSIAPQNPGPVPLHEETP